MPITFTEAYDPQELSQRTNAKSFNQIFVEAMQGSFKEGQAVKGAAILVDKPTFDVWAVDSDGVIANAPTVSGITETTAAQATGNVHINGTYLDQVTAVVLNSTPSVAGVIQGTPSATEVIARFSTATSRTGTITVTNPTTTAVSPDTVTIVAAPTITDVTPTTGDTTTDITITGTNLANITSVVLNDGSPVTGNVQGTPTATSLVVRFPSTGTGTVTVTNIKGSATSVATVTIS